jgi:diguanylate cyclase (GGDEF)-like protein
VPVSPRNRIVATAAGALALLATGGPAHAVSVTVPLPQTPVQVPQTQITAPGADVTVGPGGASVNVDPQKAIGGVTGVPPTVTQPPAPPPPAQTSTSSSPPAGGATSPGPGGSSGGDRISPGLGSRPSEGRARTGERRGSVAGGARSTPAESAGSRASVAEAGSRGDRSAPTRRRAAADPRPVPEVVRQVIEKIPQELLGLLLILALFGAAMSLVWLRERGQVRAARRLAQVDPLTGIPNRLAFERRLSDEWRRARRYDRPLGLLLLDLDGLKTVNDRDGHEAGDRMIQATARQIAEHIRQSDMAARLAGDEFVVLCPETPGAGIELLGAKLTGRLDGAGIAASVGGAEAADSDIGPNDLLARADAAMYQEKARRRGTPRERSTARPGLAIAG